MERTLPLTPNMHDGTTKMTDSETIRAQCPHCGITFRAGARRVGTQAPCPKCKATMTVGIAPEPAPTIPQAAPDTVTTLCTSCLQPFTTDAAMVGKQQHCPNCKYLVEVRPINPEVIYVRCNDCKNTSQFNYRDIGKPGMCRHCQRLIPIFDPAFETIESKLVEMQYRSLQAEVRTRIREHYLGWLMLTATLPACMTACGTTAEAIQERTRYNAPHFDAAEPMVAWALFAWLLFTGLRHVLR